MQNKRYLSLLCAIIIVCVSCSSVYATEDSQYQQTVYDLLSDWSYIDNNTVFSFNMDALSDEQLAVFYNTAPENLESAVMSFAYDQFLCYFLSAEEPVPCASGSGTHSLTFTFQDQTKTLSYSYTISAVIGSSDGLVTSISGESCSISIPWNSELTYSNFAHVYSNGIGTSYATVCYTAKFRAPFGSMYADKWDSMFENFYA